MKRVLLVAYHFPPLIGSSGIQRTLQLAKYLPEFEWEPIVLTAHPRAYENKDSCCGTYLPELRLFRAQAWDSARHLAIRGWYPSFLARPDRWIAWFPDAVRLGRRIIKDLSPSIIWSTYPISTAHLIGSALSRSSQLPWIADFRDPMAQEDYPADPKTREYFCAIERRAAKDASRLVFTTPGANKLYVHRYPDAERRMITIENGFDEDLFSGLPSQTEPLIPGKNTIVHSGIVYPSERDPLPLLDALQSLQISNPEFASSFVFRFRAAVHDRFIELEAGKRGVLNLIELKPPLPYREALDEICRADGLLLMQASNCNQQIPAKLYEYLRSGRPILTLSDPEGDTARVLREVGLSRVARLDSSADILKLICEFFSKPDDFRPRMDEIQSRSRRNGAEKLARELDALCTI